MDKKKSPGESTDIAIPSRTAHENESDLTDEHVSVTSTTESSANNKRSYEALLGPSSSAANRQKRALIIEDSMITRRVMSRMLKKLGFEVVESVNGMEGLKELQAKLFDIVFCVL